MNLQAGITELKPEWEIILKQIGPPYSVVDTESNINVEDYAVVIISAKVRKKSKDKLREYINNGGTILSDAVNVSGLFKLKTEFQYIKYLYSKNDDVFYDLPACDLFSNCYIPKNSNSLVNQNGGNVVLSIEQGRGKAIIFPSGFTAQILDTHIKRKNFYSEWGHKETDERVAKISKGAIKHYVQSALENLYKHRNLPFVNLWHFPNGEKNIFGFRVDTDFGSKDDLKELYNVCKKNNINATWFVETLSGVERLDEFIRFKNQEIALHCYRHKIFKSYSDNFSDISKGLNILKRIGQDVKGYAAPFGEWNNNLCKALGDKKFNYSSEFAYAYDALPLFPYCDDNLSGVLQVPIHPVSPGRLYWGGHDDNGIFNYYNKIIDEKLNLYDPLFLYTHPAEKRFSIFDKIFSKINSLNIPSITFNNYAEWWKKRNSTKFMSTFEDGKININAGQADNSIWKRIVFTNGEVFLSQLNDNLNVKMKKIDLPKYDPCLEDKLKSIKTTTLRMLWHDYLFRYRKMKL